MGGNRGRTGLGALATLIGAVLAGLLLSGGASAAAPGVGAEELNIGPKFVTSGPGFETLSRSEATEFWTPERLAKAQPLDLPTSGGTASRFESPPKAIPGSVPLDSTTIASTGKYPNRTHGKLFGVMGDSVYTCSATLVTSTSASMLTTAGHCVVDPATRTAASYLVFAPAYTNGQFPFFIWPVTNVITNREWGLKGNLNFDFAYLRIVPGSGRGLQNVIGSRGIAFNQPVKQRVDAYGYPASGPSPDYNGENMIRCNSGYVPDKSRDRFHRGPSSIGIRCDQQGGASGGGFVIQNSAVASVVSHGHLTRGGSIERGRVYGPRFGATAKGMYKANTDGWPSIGPVGCLGSVADFVGTLRQDKLEGNAGADRFSSLGKNDRLKGREGPDRLCGGEGADRLIAGPGRDILDGGDGRDRCFGGKTDKFRHCEITKRTGR